MLTALSSRLTHQGLIKPYFYVFRVTLSLQPSSKRVCCAFPGWVCQTRTYHVKQNVFFRWQEQQSVGWQNTSQPPKLSSTNPTMRQIGLLSSLPAASPLGRGKDWWPGCCQQPGCSWRTAGPGRTVPTLTKDSHRTGFPLRWKNVFIPSGMRLSSLPYSLGKESTTLPGHADLL